MRFYKSPPNPLKALSHTLPLARSFSLWVRLCLGTPSLSLSLMNPLLARSLCTLMATDWDYHAGVCEESTRWTSPFFSYSWTKCRTLPPATHTHQDDGPPSLWEIRWAAIWFVLSLYASAHTCTHTHALPFTHLSTLAQWWRIWERKIGFFTTECSWIRFIIDLSWCSGKKNAAGRSVCNSPVN